MREKGRCFAPLVGTRLSEFCQARPGGVIAALHHVAPVQVWCHHIIRRGLHDPTQAQDWAISRLTLDRPKSQPVSAAIKARGSERVALLEAHTQSPQHVTAGRLQKIIPISCSHGTGYASELALARPMCGVAMHLELTAFSTFDLYVFRRARAKCDYAPGVLVDAELYLQATLDPDQ